jgi:hypothetical protein
LLQLFSVLAPFHAPLNQVVFHSNRGVVAGSVHLRQPLSGWPAEKLGVASWWLGAPECMSVKLPGAAQAHWRPVQCVSRQRY